VCQGLEAQYARECVCKGPFRRLALRSGITGMREIPPAIKDRSEGAEADWRWYVTSRASKSTLAVNPTQRRQKSMSGSQCDIFCRATA